MAAGQSVQRELDPAPDIGSQQLRRILMPEELSGSKLNIYGSQSRDLPGVEYAAIEDEYERVVPWTVRRRPINDEQFSTNDLKTQFLSHFSSGGFERRFVGLGHTTWQIPIRFVSRVYKQYAPDIISNDDFGSHALPSLLGVPLRQVRIPFRRIVSVLPHELS
jgi:hypothetical protein